MTDEPLIVRVVCSGPLLGRRTVTPAWFISAEESANALRKKEAAMRTAAWRNERANAVIAREGSA
jgi:hypothetical protein